MTIAPPDIHQPAPQPAPRPAARRRSVRWALLPIALIASVVACSKQSPSPEAGSAAGDPAGCLVVPLAASPEKIDLLTELSRTFNLKRAQVNGNCVFIDPKSKSSGGSTQLLADNWDEKAEGSRPVIWSPAGSTWGAILDQRLAVKGQKAMAGVGTPFMSTPLVIAMPKPMAESLGWPNTPLGWSDVLKLANDTNGWASYGHPEWGPFRLGKTNPNFSTSGLSALVAQNYAAAGKTKDLSKEDIDKPDVIDFNKAVESAVVHYGDTTLSFLNNWYRSDQRGTPYSYASAVAVEEKSVIDYNKGNPDGVLAPGEAVRPPRVPLVAIYPKEGTLFSDNPFFILDASWVSEEQKQGARIFQDFVQEPDNQRKALEFGFRPGNTQVAIGEPVTTANGADPTQPQTLLQVPSPPVMVSLLDAWGQNRKTARVLLVLDVSGSMGDPGSNGETKLDLAKKAAIDALDQFKDDDLVGLRVFSTNLGTGATPNQLDLVPVGPVGSVKEELRTKIRDLEPRNGTPLYDVATTSFQTMLDGYDATRINAVVLLTDGKNEDGNPSDDNRQFIDLTRMLQSQTQGENAKPIRLFTIGYGADADLSKLKEMAEAANGASYNASDPKSIAKVFTQVISNF